MSSADITGSDAFAALFGSGRGGRARESDYASYRRYRDELKEIAEQTLVLALATEGGASELFDRRTAPSYEAARLRKPREGSLFTVPERMTVRFGLPLLLAELEPGKRAGSPDAYRFVLTVSARTCAEGFELQRVLSATQLRAIRAPLAGAGSRARVRG